MVSGSVAHEIFPKGTLSPASPPAGQSGPVIGYVGISYPFAVLDKITLYSGTLVLNNIQRYKGPKLLVMGTADDFTKGYEQGLLPKLDRAKLQIDQVEGENHFWFGKEGLITEKMLPWLKDVVGLDVSAKPPAAGGSEARL